MTGQQRDVLELTPEQFEDVDRSVGWKHITESHYDKRRFAYWSSHGWWYVVQNVSTGKFYKYYGEVYSGDYYGDDSDSNTELTELTEVFPRTIEITVYDQGVGND